MGKGGGIFSCSYLGNSPKGPARKTTSKKNSFRLGTIAGTLAGQLLTCKGSKTIKLKFSGPKQDRESRIAKGLGEDRQEKFVKASRYEARWDLVGEKLTMCETWSRVEWRSNKGDCSQHKGTPFDGADEIEKQMTSATIEKESTDWAARGHTRGIIITLGGMGLKKSKPRHESCREAGSRIGRSGRAPEREEEV